MEPLDPQTAAQLFFAGTELAYVSAPTQPFVAGRWLGQLVICTPIPFEDAVTYFTIYPVIIAADYVPPAPGVAVSAVMQVKGAGWTAKGTDMAVTLEPNQTVALTVAWADANGHAAAQPGPVTWASDTTANVTVAVGTPDDTATATAVANGNANITAVSGGITGTIEITVAAGAATTATITAGTPQGT